VSTILVNPLDERVPPQGAAAPRLRSVGGARVALLDISKGGGSVFLDRLDSLLRSRECAAGRGRKQSGFG
jgi:hypothetical protein